MDSDDSASEVASEAGDYEDSFVADEVEESVDQQMKKSTPQTTLPVAISRTVPASTSVPTTAPRSNLAQIANDDDAKDAYENDFDEYSLDFEEEGKRSDKQPVSSAKSSLSSLPYPRPPSPSRIAAPSSTSPVRPVSVIKENTEYEYDSAYGEASFETADESQRGASSPNRHVDLSVRVRRDSSSSADGGGGGGSPIGKAAFNSPNVNLRVLSKPSMSRATTAVASGMHGGGGYGTVLPGLNAAALAILDGESDRSLSLLLRKLESKYHDEVEELREQNSLLTWKERESKAELRRLREELKMRKTRIEKKRKRALDRRRENEEVVERLRSDVVKLSTRLKAADDRAEVQRQDNEHLRHALNEAEVERRAVEERNLTLAESMQRTLSDFHALNIKYETAVRARLEAECAVDELKMQHRLACEVIEHKARVDVDAISKVLNEERDLRVQERQSLPEIHRIVVEAERERIARLEAEMKRQAREAEAQLAKESVRFEKELALAWEAKRVTEERVEKRLQDELAKIARERESIDEQRRELLLSITRTSSRFDEERGKLDSLREQLEIRRIKLVEERAEIDARRSYLQERVHRLAQEESLVDARKAELTKLGKETFDKSKVLTQKMNAFAEMRAELEQLRAASTEMKSKAHESEAREQQLSAEKAALEQRALALQHERLYVAKQRMQSKHFLDGAKKLEELLHQQKALEQVVPMSMTGGTANNNNTHVKMSYHPNQPRIKIDNQFTA